MSVHCHSVWRIPIYLVCFRVCRSNMVPVRSTSQTYCAGVIARSTYGRSSVAAVLGYVCHPHCTISVLVGSLITRRPRSHPLAPIGLYRPFRCGSSTILEVRGFAPRANCCAESSPSPLVFGAWLGSFQFSALAYDMKDLQANML